MSVAPYKIQCYRDRKWQTISTDELLPGDVVSLVRLPSSSGSNMQSHATETTIPADLLFLRGTCIVNEAMLSVESTLLLKEDNEPLDVDGTHRNAVLSCGTKVLQSSAGGNGETPDGGCLVVVLRTGFGTAQGQLVRTTIFSTERVSANNLESFVFIGSLLIFAIAASWYVWTKGAYIQLNITECVRSC